MPECPFCFEGFQRGQKILCCGIDIRNDVRHNVHAWCQQGTICYLCRHDGMQENSVLQAQLESGEVPSNINEVPVCIGTSTGTSIYLYMGTWRNNAFHGPGKLTRPNGIIEEGTFQYGRRHGLFKITTPFDVVIDCHYDKGKVHGLYKATHHPSGSVIEKTYCQGILHGQYKKTQSRAGVISETIESTYIDGKRQGLATITREDETVITFHYKDDKLHGEWKKVYPSGTVERKMYHDDKVVQFTLDKATAEHAPSSKASVLGKRDREDNEDNVTPS